MSLQRRLLSDTGNLRGTRTLNGGLRFTALNYSHSIAPAKLLSGEQGFYPLLYGVEVRFSVYNFILVVDTIPTQQS